jgi:hypothetical protein
MDGYCGRNQHSRNILDIDSPFEHILEHSSDTEDPWQLVPQTPDLPHLQHRHHTLKLWVWYSTNILKHDANEITLQCHTSATLLPTLVNIPSIVASSFFGYLSVNKRFPLSATTITSTSAVGAALSAFRLWGLTSQGSVALFVLFSITFGFFGSGYCTTWGGVANELEREAGTRSWADE